MSVPSNSHASPLSKIETRGLRHEDRHELVERLHRIAIAQHG